jgi:hypothetical protein
MPRHCLRRAKPRSAVLRARTGGGRQRFALVGLTGLDGRAEGGKVAAEVIRLLAG